MSQDVIHPLCPYSEEEKHNLRRELGLKESIIQDSIDSIVEWFQRQPHLAAAGVIDRDVAERIFLIAKGSIEKAKYRIDGYYKYRALAPELIQERDVLLDSNKGMWTFFTHSMMPRLYQGKRITVLTFTDPDPSVFQSDFILKTSLMLCDLRLRYDYANRDIWVMDFRNVSIGHVLRLNPLTCKKASLIFHEGLGLGVHNVHVVNCSLASKLQILINILKQTANPKFLDRLIVHKCLEDLHKYIPKEYLPKDIGGDLPSCEEFRAQYEKEIRSPNTKKILVEMSKMVSHESLRLGGGYDENSLAGSFKRLEFD